MSVAVTELGGSIWEAFDRPGDDRPHLICVEGRDHEAFTWDDWRRQAERTAAGLHALGIRRGQRVAGVLTNTFDVCASVVGAWLLGVMVVSLPVLRRGMPPEEYVDQLRRLAASSGADALLLEERFIGLLGSEDTGVPVHSYGSLQRDGAAHLAPLRHDEPAFVQYSSGSTNEPKGVVLSMGAISEQEAMLAERLEVDGDSQGVMWLPLSHDMGLFGCVLLSWSAGMRLVVSTPERFLRKPQTWFDDCAEVGATITVAPNFGLALAARIARTKPPRGSFPMRTVVLGGERIEMDTLRTAAEVLGPYGVSWETLTPAYGLAEGTLAVTMKDDGDAPTAKRIDPDSALRGELTILADDDPRGTEIVSCGPPMTGVSVRTANDPADTICIRSASLAEGYLGEPAVTAKRFVDGEFRTEDLGFVLGESLYVIGRTDDVIAIGGRNIHARDVEREVDACDGVRPGCSLLLDMRTEEEVRLVLVAEADRDVANFGELTARMRSAAFHACGANVAECIFLHRGQLPKTPSGKIQRYRCRKLVLEGGPAIAARYEL